MVLELILLTVLPPMELPPERLHHAAYLGDRGTVLAELQAGAAVNAKSVHDWTPLHLAAIGAQAATAELLLEHGADPDARAEYDLTPLHWAVLRGHDAVAGILVSRGAKLGARSLYGMTPLHLVGTKAVVEVLAEGGARLDARDDLGLTPLFTSRTKEAGQALMARGADIHARARDGRTLFDMLVVNTMEETHGLLFYGRRSAGRLRGETADVDIRVINLWPVTRRRLSLHVETEAASAMDPPLLERLAPGEMATLTFRLERRADVQDGEYPLAAQVTLDGEALDVFKLDLDTSRHETPVDRGFSRLGGARIRTTPSKHYELFLLAVPLLVLAGWWWARRRRSATAPDARSS